MTLLVLYIVEALIVGWTLLYAVPALANPVAFWGRFGEWEFGDRSFLARMTVYASLFFIWLGFFILCYHAAQGLIDWMPYDWGGHDEDGEWQATRPVAQGVVALVGSFTLLAVTEAASEAGAKRTLEERVMWAMAEAVKKPSYRTDTADAYRQRVYDAAKSILSQPIRGEGAGLRKYRERTLWMMTPHDLEQQP